MNFSNVVTLEKLIHVVKVPLTSSTHKVLECRSAVLRAFLVVTTHRDIVVREAVVVALSVNALKPAASSVQSVSRTRNVEAGPKKL